MYVLDGYNINVVFHFYFILCFAYKNYILPWFSFFFTSGQYNECHICQHYSSASFACILRHEMIVSCSAVPRALAESSGILTPGTAVGTD